MRVSFYSVNELREFIGVHKDPIPRDKKSKVVYKISCKSCDASYVGQTCRQLKSRITEHKNHIRTTCQWCDKPSHSANNCWKKQNEQHNPVNKVKVVCQICNNFGHNARDCRSKIGQNAASSDSLFCRYCKGQGHLLESCELRIASNNRRKINEQGNSDGPSKSDVAQGSEGVSHPSTSKKGQ
ncbi:hypothetical protein ALC57_10116 [Trachymyrmex cornetzi]|uniref:CCHC-type domain-containing protein n=1 Tax=Trachymyrmex cornetzi TaxID=471704 RepID=A0A151J4N8_9HYME|nr:hypothetical protein ALC57_10116 [Trachymyrmex cornetzi]